MPPIIWVKTHHTGTRATIGVDIVAHYIHGRRYPPQLSNDRSHHIGKFKHKRVVYGRDVIRNLTTSANECGSMLLPEQTSVAACVIFVADNIALDSDTHDSWQARPV